MLSIGIRFGQGFDFATSIKIMQSAPEEYTYDLAVLGTDPGGLALAREASAAGKKVVVVRWKNYSPAEQEGKEEDLDEMSFALSIPFEKTPSIMQQIMENSSDRAISSLATVFKRDRRANSSIKSEKHVSKMIQSIKSKISATKKAKRDRKVRYSRLDLNNEFYKRGQEGRKLMRNATMYNNKVEESREVGWRVPQIFTPITFNWNKMSENVMDHIMKENWKLASLLNVEKVDIIEGRPVFVSNNTVKITEGGDEDSLISAEIICIAPTNECVFPSRCKGAYEFGITSDDFVRLEFSPQKTLIIGATPDGLECAGIVALSGHPVTVMTKTKNLVGHDSEIVKIIVEDLKKKGVIFLERTTVVKIEMAHDDEDRLLVKYDTSESSVKIQQNEPDRSEDLSAFSDFRRRRKLKEELFDTVVFASSKKVDKEFMNLEVTGIKLDSSGDIPTNEFDSTLIPNIYALGSCVSIKPKSLEVSDVAGRLLGQRLYHGSKVLMDYTLHPTVIYTPIEYAFIGISEDSASIRLGPQCIEVYAGYFTPLEHIIPPKPGLCYMKIIIHSPRGTVIGVHIVGPEAGEIIQGFVVCVQRGLTIDQLHCCIGVGATKAKEILKLKLTKKPDKTNIGGI